MIRGISGHTMATPRLTVLEAIVEYSTLGLDGIEIIWQDDYKCGLPEQVDHSMLAQVRDTARDVGITIVGLAPYMRATNSTDDDDRRESGQRFRKCVDDAAELGAANVRFYGGGLESPGSPGDRWRRLVDSLHSVGDYAHGRGVRVLVENHMGTMTESARDTARLVAEADSPGVGVLYDQVNLLRSGAEEHRSALDIQGPLIGHVHVKDFEPSGAGREDVRSAPSRAVGDGVMPWGEVLADLLATGYDGFLSLEYETRWNPDDLPPPEIGLPLSAGRLRTIVKSIESASVTPAG